MFYHLLIKKFDDFNDVGHYFISNDLTISNMTRVYQFNQYVQVSSTYDGKINTQNEINPFINQDLSYPNSDIYLNRISSIPLCYMI